MNLLKQPSNIIKYFFILLSTYWVSVSSRWGNYKLDLEKHNYTDPYPPNQSDRKKQKMRGKRVALADLKKPPSERTRF
jgi:hypothetical protein